MKRRLSPLPVAVATVALGFAAAAIAGEPGAGKAVYDAAKPACKGCHTDVKNPLTRAGAENRHLGRETLEPEGARAAPEGVGGAEGEATSDDAERRAACQVQEVVRVSR